MARTSVSFSVPSVTNSPADLGPEIRRALAALADVETRYETECEQMERWAGPVAWKDRVRAGIEARHMRERQPIVQRLADLQREMTAALMFGRLRHH